MQRQLFCTGLAVVGVLTATASHAQVVGAWRAETNRHRSPIRLDIAANGLTAHVGCLYYSGDYRLSGTEIRHTGNDYNSDGPCNVAEASDPAAIAYWRQIERTVYASTRAEVKNGVLTLSGPRLPAIRFVRRPSGSKDAPVK
jgi:hypothetical protein